MDQEGAFGRLFVVCVFVCISVAAVMVYYGFALTATHFFYKRLKKVSKKTLAPTCGPLAGARGSFAPGSIRGHRLRFAALHLLSMHLAAPNGRCAPTPGSIPPLSLPMSPYRSRSRAGELTLGLLCGEERVFGFGSVLDSPLIGTPPAQHSPEGEGADLLAFQRLSSTRYCTSAYLPQTPRSVPSPSGRGLG